MRCTRHRQRIRKERKAFVSPNGLFAVLNATNAECVLFAFAATIFHFKHNVDCVTVAWRRHTPLKWRQSRRREKKIVFSFECVSIQCKSRTQNGKHTHPSKGKAITEHIFPAPQPLRWQTHAFHHRLLSHPHENAQ